MTCLETKMAIQCMQVPVVYEQAAPQMAVLKAISHHRRVNVHRRQASEKVADRLSPCVAIVVRQYAESKQE